MVLILDGNSEIGAEIRNLLSDMFKAFDERERNRKSNFLFEITYFPSCVRTMLWVTIYYEYHV